MHIVHIASELAPIAKVGGLGDVLYGLTQELIRLNHTLEVILPKYDCFDLKNIEQLKIEIPDMKTKEGIANTIWSGSYHGIQLILIETHHPAQFFHRKTIYGCSDDLERFTYFSHAALAYLEHTKLACDIIHLHDWPTALIAVMLRMRKTTYKTVLTIHNLEHQGKCSPTLMTHVGLDPNAIELKEMMQDPVDPRTFNILKGGILAADAITTVSPTYQKEILTIQGGCGLQETLAQSTPKLTGILNGIDEQFWNPQLDPYLVTAYSTSQTQLDAIIAGKTSNRNYLASQLHMQASSQPLVACISRLVPQKSPELIQAALLRTLEKGGQFILLGTTQIPEIHAQFTQLQEEFRNNPDVAILLDYDEALSHLIFAAADLFIIPSLFEPCGLTQLIALRYGTIPVARRTGGLADTVFDLDTATQPLEQRNGFTFDFPDKEGLYWALDRALACYRNHPHIWRQLLSQGIQMDFSWKQTAPEYVTIYERLTMRLAVYK